MTRSKPVSCRKALAARSQSSRSPNACSNVAAACSRSARTAIGDGMTTGATSSSTRMLSPARCAVTSSIVMHPRTWPSGTVTLLGLALSRSATGWVRRSASVRLRHEGANIASMSPAPRTTLRSEALATSRMPCGWIDPGTWIGSRSHAVMSSSLGLIPRTIGICAEPGITGPSGKGTDYATVRDEGDTMLAGSFGQVLGSIMLIDQEIGIGECRCLTSFW